MSFSEKTNLLLSGFKEKVKNSRNRLYNGNCIDVMRETLEDGSVDLTITSPPYDKLRKYKNSLEWDFEIFKKIANELYRVTKNGGVVVWVVGDSTINGSETGTSFKQALYFKEIGFNLHDTMIWEKAGIAFPESNRYYQIFEYIFILSKRKPKTFNVLKDRKNIYANTLFHGTDRQSNGKTVKSHAVKNNLKRKTPEYGVRYNVWKIPNTGKAGTIHPATFPEQLAHDHIISWSNENDIVLDPMCGSGTVGKMCKKLNRQFIGIEKVKEYYDISKKRINEK